MGARQVKPSWIRIRASANENFASVKDVLDRNRLKTVCTSAQCPNIFECWSAKTATFMILGNLCTRNCRFCNVKSGNPNGYLDPSEKDRLASAVRSLGLAYVVLTSVDRDDLSDHGSSHFAACIQNIKKIKGTRIEALIPDFNCNEEFLKKISGSNPDVVGHNIETVRRLTHIRDKRAGYEKSLDVLRIIKKQNKSITTKSSIILGLGETENEVMCTMQDLRKSNVDILTLGQYLRPSEKCIPVKSYIPPEKFQHYKAIAINMGFSYVVSSPFARSSYKAAYLNDYISSELERQEPYSKTIRYVSDEIHRKS